MSVDAFRGSLTIMLSGQNPFAPDALRRTVPRYTSYPTAPHFSEAVDAGTFGRWLGEIPRHGAVSLYLHIPFCDELCWFCACRTQGSKNYRPVARYLDFLLMEIERVAALTGGGHAVSQMHWGGGSPTILAPDDMRRLADAVHAAFPGSRGAEFAVEIDPRDMTDARLDALAAAGLSRASVGVQDFDERVQRAIGRRQGHAMTRDVIEGLRARGVGGVNIDLLYGLPGQTAATLTETIERVIELAPDRLALFGYAHVPWMAKRQTMIDESLLPGTDARRQQAALAADLLQSAGYVAIGIDHFARPGDAMAEAAAARRLRRNFQGYTVDDAVALIGMGASAISALPRGYAQNAAATADWQRAIEAGGLATRRGAALSADDRARRDAIEMLLCDFSLDLVQILLRHGEAGEAVAATAEHLCAIAPEGALVPTPEGFALAPGWRAHARLIAAEFDAYLGRRPARHSLAV